MTKFSLLSLTLAAVSAAATVILPKENTEVRRTGNLWFDSDPGNGKKTCVNGTSQQCDYTATMSMDSDTTRFFPNSSYDGMTTGYNNTTGA